jgi:hypothetical protein
MTPGCILQNACNAGVVSFQSLLLPQTAAQGVLVSMSLLTCLTIRQWLTDQDAQMLAAVRLDTLHSLNVRMDLCHAWFLQACQQLKALHLVVRNVKGASAIAQLTGLTQLQILSATPTQQLFSAAEQSELGSALAALSNLQSLSISHAPPGPVTLALSQLTRLTELMLYQQQVVDNAGPLVLPSCVKLTLYYNMLAQHLASIDAPQLRSLELTMALKPSDLDALRWLCRGVLRACSSLALDLKHASSKEDTVALMELLGQDWQPLRPSSIKGLEGSSSSGDAPSRWSLQLRSTHCSRQSLELLPKGLGSLCLGWVLWLHALMLITGVTHMLCSAPSASYLLCSITVTYLDCPYASHRDCSLDPDSLDPLAQLASLRELNLVRCSGVTLETLERLFSTSVTGCMLKVTVSDSMPAEACRQMRQAVIAQRGSRDTPLLQIWS